MTVYKAIDSAKQRLIKQAQTKGLSENFGQNEVRKIKTKYNPMFNDQISINERNQQMKAIDAFDDWCANYTG